MWGMWGFKYKDGTTVKVGDKVLISKKYADNNANGNRKATVVGLRGFVTVELDEDKSHVDFDMRSITKQ